MPESFNAAGVGCGTTVPNTWTTPVPVSIEDTLRAFGWEVTDDFMHRYWTDPLIYNLTEALRRLVGCQDACLKALQAIAPCVVGWKEGEMPVWAEKLNTVVPELRRVLGFA